MSRRTKTHTVIPWIGGINTSVDPGVLNQQELIQADNVVFSSAGARIKRESLEYLDPEPPSPNRKSSSTTTRTLKWTTTPLVNITNPNERLVVGERITVTGDSDYNISDTPILSRTEILQVTTVQCVADVAGSLNNKYFLLSAGDEQSDYYVWYNVSAGGVDPMVPNRIGLEVAIATNDGANAVASATSAVIHAEDDFNASVSTDTITVTCAIGGVTDDASAGNSGFTVLVTVQGGHSITYASDNSFTESETSTSAILIERASSVIFVKDYWRFTGVSNDQLLIYATDDFQLFSLDDGRRVQIHGQGQVTSIVCGNAASLTDGDYFLINSGGDEIEYYVWINKDGGGSDPSIAGKTGVPVVVTTGDTAPQVATAVKNAIDALVTFTATVDTNTVSAEAVDAGITEDSIDVSTGFTITTTLYGATAPTVPVSTIRSVVFNEDLIMVFSGLGNKPIMYNPDDDEKYQLLSPLAPDASIIWEHQGRLWTNDKTDRDNVHYSPTFDHLTWGGIDDSGAFPIAPGDGDPEGIVNGYSYKGFMVVAKKASRHRILGDSPENYQRETISEGLGNEGSLAVPVDEVDVVFMSRRGIHSQEATDRYGDTDAAYLSAKIKPTFNDWNPARLKYTQGAYIPELNSIAFSIAGQGDASQSEVWLYNTEIQIPNEQPGAWYRWPDISCQSLARRFTEDQYKLVFGTNNGRLIQAQVSNDYTDFGTEGIEFAIKSGIIYPGEQPQSMKAFKKLTMYYRPRGNFSFTAKVYIDNFPAQAFSFNQISGLDLLGETFILGNSILGASAGFAPFTFTLDGIGRGAIVELVQPSADEQIEVWGFAFEYEPADLEQEVKD